MNNRAMSWAFWSVLFLAWTPTFVGGQPVNLPTSVPLLDAEAMAACIDHHLAASWKEKGVQPAPRAEDAEFFRRLSLDLNGCIPSIVHLKDFLDDSRINKRHVWVNKFMDGCDPDSTHVDKKLPVMYVHHFTNIWRTVLFARTANQDLADLGLELEPWLRRILQENRSYAELVAQLLTGQGQPFFQAHENRPESLAGSTARLFLGVRLECAQCHEDRSGGAWTQEQFWEFAAFFAKANAQQPAGLPPTIRFNQNRIVAAKFLDGQTPVWQDGDNPRVVLAKWLTSAANPYFARAAVNRMWQHFFGIGLNDPVDHMAIQDNPPSHPELLDELARQFAAHQFDLKYLIRAIAYSQAYQRSSARSHPSQDDRRLFARMPVRGLSWEQLFDSLLMATLQETWPPAVGRGLGGPNNPRAEFRLRFANIADKQTEPHTSSLQALYLMNSRFMADLVGRSGGSLHTITNAGPQVPLTRRLEELYLITLSRRPRPEEMDRLLKYVQSIASPSDALADVFWALLNSAEFISNH